MRFQIKKTQKRHAAYHFCLEDETAIPVRHAPFFEAIKFNELIWTWLDDKEYVIRIPRSHSKSSKPGLRIFSEERELCSGCFYLPSVLEMIPRRRLGYIEWEFDNDLVTSETKLMSKTRWACRGLNVLRRQSDRKLLAAWRYRSGSGFSFGRVVEVVCRPSLSTENLAVLLGMILTEMEIGEMYDN